MAQLLNQLRILHSELASDLVEFFHFTRAIKDKNFLPPKVSDFFSESAYNSSSILSPNLINLCCRKLVDANILSPLAVGGALGMDNSYMSNYERDKMNPKIGQFRARIDAAVYGFASIFDSVREKVVPVINFDLAGDQQIGTAFFVQPRTLVTALHCLQPASGIAIRGVSADALHNAIFLRHPNPAIDVCIIVLNNHPADSIPLIFLRSDDAPVLTEVMALGYPNVPGFMPTLTAESATVSGRLTAVEGRVASSPLEIFARKELLLITARVHGGFSGGPIFDLDAQVVGMISREPVAENSKNGITYDTLGYGTAIPSSLIFEVAKGIDDVSFRLDMSQIDFRDFI